MITMVSTIANGGTYIQPRVVKEIIKKLEAMDPVIPLNIFKSTENVDLPMILSYKDREGRHEFNQRFDSNEI